MEKLCLFALETGAVQKTSCERESFFVVIFTTFDQKLSSFKYTCYRLHPNRHSERHMHVGGEFALQNLYTKICTALTLVSKNFCIYRVVNISIILVCLGCFESEFAKRKQKH